MPETTTLRSGTIRVDLLLGDNAFVPFASSAAGAAIIDEALVAPLELPPLNDCVVPGDRVVIVADPETPLLPEILTSVWERLAVAMGSEISATILLPPDPTGRDWQAFQELLPEHLRRQIPVHIHNPDDESGRSYLASSAGGERIYLSTQLIDADFIVNVGMIGFSGVLGYGGTTSSIYPALSDAGAIRSARRTGHIELTPDDKRPLRELVDEIGWLLGLQFAVQIIPASDGGVARVISGAIGPVMRAGQTALNDNWRITHDSDVELVVVSVPGQRQEFDWKHIGAALATASKLVAEDGRIVVVADCEAPHGPGLQMLRRCREPEELLRPLSLEPPVDAVESVQLIRALQRARVYLLSHLPEDLVEDLGLLAMSSAGELQRLVDSAESVAVIANANYAWAEIQVPV
ncbi:MAG: lactate racemase domain-containing protein [Planctomycetaceae bacterium]